MLKKNTSFSGPVEEVEKKYRYGIQQIPLYMEKIEVPTIAAINGPAVGAGFDLACMCDFRIMSNNAFLAESFINLGIIVELNFGSGTMSFLGCDFFRDIFIYLFLFRIKIFFVFYLQLLGYRDFLLICDTSHQADL